MKGDHRLIKPILWIFLVCEIHSNMAIIPRGCGMFYLLAYLITFCYLKTLKFSMLIGRMIIWTSFHWQEGGIASLYTWEE